MSKMWGYHLAERSCNRGYRFSYRSFTKYCLILDVSYLCCVEITGPLHAILAGLKHLCDQRVGLTFAAKSMLKGTQQGQTMVYKADQYPFNPLGTATFLWRYIAEPQELRTLWIWVHPSIHEDLLIELANAYKSSLDESGSVISDPAVQVTWVSNKDKLNRFRLRGPRSYSALSTLLEAGQRDLARCSLPPGAVVAVDARDPRVVLPRHKCQPQVEPVQSNVPLDRFTAKSELWDASVRDRVANLRKVVTDHHINERRSKLLVPGSQLEMTSDECRIPIMIINAPFEGDSKQFML